MYADTALANYAEQLNDFSNEELLQILEAPCADTDRARQKRQVVREAILERMA